MQAAIIKVCSNLQRALLIVVLFYATAAFGGVPLEYLHILRFLLLFCASIEVIRILFDPKYFGGFDLKFFWVLFLFALFLSLVYAQYFFGLKILESSKIGSLRTYATLQNLMQLILYAFFFFMCWKETKSRRYVEQLSGFILVFIFLISSLSFIQKLSAVYLEEQILWGPFIEKIFPNASLFGPFIYENQFGGFIGVTFLLPVALVLYRIELLKDGFAKEKKSFSWRFLNFFNLGIPFFFVLSTLTISVAFLSMARASSLVIIFCLFVFLIYCRLIVKNSKNILLLLAILSFSFLFLWWAGFNLVTTGFALSDLYSSFSARLIASQQSLSIVKEYPFFGTGLGTYGYISTKFVNYLAQFSLWWNHAHNNYLELITDTGLIGFALLTGSLFLLILSPLRKLRSNPSRWARIVSLQAFFSILAIAIMEFFDFHLRAPCIALFFLLQIAILNQASRSKINGSNVGSIFRIPVALILVFLISYLSYLEAIDYRAFLLSRSHDLAQLKRATQLQPSNPELWIRLADGYVGRSKLEGVSENQLQHEALHALQRAVALSPTFEFYWAKLAYLQARLGYLSDAVSSYERALYWDPSNKRAMIALIVLYFKYKEKVPKEAGATELKIKHLYRRLIEGKLSNLEEIKQIIGDHYYTKFVALTE